MAEYECDCGEGEVTWVNSVRLGRQRPFCTGCGNPLDWNDLVKAATS